MLMPPRKRRQQGGSSSSAESGGSNRRGRPMKRIDELKPSRKARTQEAQRISMQLATQAASTGPKALPKLEELPKEILQIIFFHCLELNLPRASPILAKSLSGRSIYTALVLLAYYEAESTIGHLETKHFEKHHFKPATYRRIVRDERVRLQNSVVRCRWFTLEFFETCLPILSRLKMVECWCREERALKAMVGRRSPAEQEALPLLDVDILLPKLADTSAMESYFHATIQHHREEIERNAQFMPPGHVDPTVGPTNNDGYLPFIKRTLSWRQNGERATTQSRTVLTVRVLPNYVLQGAPWTDSKIKMLQFLRQGLRYEALDRNLVVSLDALFSGMANAISEGNEKALLVLLELHITVLKRTAAVRDEWSNGSIYPPVNPLPLRLFHLACQEAALTSRMRSGIISLLFRGGVEEIPFDDVVMTRWATHVRSRASSSDEEVRMSRWLLSYMEKRGSATGASRLRDSDYIYQQSLNGRPLTSRIGYIRSDLPPDLPWSIDPAHALEDN